jgi:hypothetical protein
VLPERGVSIRRSPNISPPYSCTSCELELASLPLRITCPSWFDGRRVADLLVQFRRRCPEIVLDVSFEDRLVDLVEEGYDIALRVTAVPDSLPAGLIARPVRSVQFYIGGSREYLKRKGTPKAPEDLAQHDFVGVGECRHLDSQGPTFDTNVLGVILCMKHEVRVMQKQGSGNIINISSTYGHEGAAGGSVYVGSKGTPLRAPAAG